MITICILASSRLDLLKRCVQSVRKLRSLETSKVFLFIQKGNQEVENYAFENLESFDLVTYITKKSDIAAENIKCNREIGYGLAFSFDDCELTIFLEDDVEVSKDLLEFSIIMNDFYKHKKDFHGINYGSVLEYNKLNTFSLLRYGMHGPASAISRQAWKKYLKNQKKLSSFSHFDGIIEYVLKTGFMVSPNRSLYFDNGIEGSHTGPDDISFFRQLKKSFRSDVESRNLIYERVQMEAKWRYPANRYKRYLNLLYKLNLTMVARPSTRKIAHKIEHYSNFF
jgi:hypothetical protein